MPCRYEIAAKITFLVSHDDWHITIGLVRQITLFYSLNQLFHP